MHGMSQISRDITRYIGLMRMSLLARKLQRISLVPVRDTASIVIIRFESIIANVKNIIIFPVVLLHESLNIISRTQLLSNTKCM